MNSLICKIETKPEELIVYTDSSLRHEHGTRLTGAGIVAYRLGEAIFQEQMALGECTEVYDAKMEGLARGVEVTREWMNRMGINNRVWCIRFFADNTGAIHRIYKGTPGLDQACSTCFRNAAHHILDTRPDLKIIISWVPGRHNITGNDTADELAKKGSSDALICPGYVTAAYAGNICRRALRERWQHEWRQDTSHQRHSDFRIANKLAPTINPPKRFKEPDQKSFSRVIQCRTGHAHIGSYYDYFEIIEPKSCICGAAFLLTAALKW